MRRFLWACVLVAGCAQTAQVVREDWVAVPGPEGREIIRRSDYAKVPHPKGRRAPNMERIPPPLLSAGSSLVLTVGEVRTYLLVDEPLRSMAVQGGAFQAFWSTPYYIDRMENGHLVEHKGADVHLRGVSGGEGDLLLDLADGTSRTLHVTVRAGPRRTVGS